MQNPSDFKIKHTLTSAKKNTHWHWQSHTTSRVFSVVRVDPNCFNRAGPGFVQGHEGIGKLLRTHILPLSLFLYRHLSLTMADDSNKTVRPFIAFLLYRWEDVEIGRKKEKKC